MILNQPWRKSCSLRRLLQAIIFTLALAFLIASAARAQSGIDSRPSNLNLIRPDGTGRRSFVYSPLSQDSLAVPSPTRDEIAFVSTRGNNGDIFLADLEEVGVRNLSNSQGRFEKFPVWSPDGELLAATVLDKTVPEKQRESNIIVFTREGEVLLEVPGRYASWMSPWAEPEVEMADGASAQSE